MKKYFFSIVCTAILTSFFSVALAQNSETANPNALNNLTILKRSTVKEDKIETLDVSGVGTTIFSTSNTADGSAASYKHALKITLNLVVTGAKENYQIVFYSAEDPSPVAATSFGGTTYVYYPISLYETIKAKLDQALAARKKIQLKVTQTKAGFREAVLTL